MSEIIPRWEWRTFGRRFGAAEAVFAAMTPTDTADSDERYLIAPDADTVKVRFDLLDVKVLREVDADGLERWEPVMKAPFPMDPGAVAAVFAALRLAPPPLEAAEYSQDDVVALLTRPGSPVRDVPVHKHRVRYAIDGCMAELSEVTVGERSTRTLAIEATDAAAVIGAVRRIGLGSHRNTSYPKGLAALLDDIPERVAVIDCGTNSIKFHVAERTADGSWRPVVDRAEVTRLGEGLEAEGIIGEAPLERAVAAIAGMAAEAESLGAVAVAAVGTAGLRIARNGAEVVEEIRRRTGVGIEIISGEDESRLAYLAATSSLGLGDGTLVVFDTGGGSSQFSFGHGSTVDERFSVDVGAVRYTERFGLAHAVPAAVVEEALAAIAADLDRLDGRAAPEALVGMGGGITNLTAVSLGLATYDPVAVHGTRLPRAEIEREIEQFRSLDTEARRSIVGLQPKRAEVILAGACIVRTVMDKLGADSLIVSDRGLRHGVLAERFGA